MTISLGTKEEGLLRTTRGKGRQTSSLSSVLLVCLQYYLQSISFHPTLTIFFVVHFFFPSSFEGSQNPDESSISFPITFMYKDVPMQFVYYRKAETSQKSCICIRMSTSTRKPRWGQKLHLMMSTARSTQSTHLHTLNSVQQLLQFIVRFMKHVHPQAVIWLSNFTALYFQHFSIIHKLKPLQRPFPQANCRSFATQSLSVVLSFPKHLTCVKLCYVFH